MPINLQPVFRHPSRAKAFLYTLLFFIAAIAIVGLVIFIVGWLVGLVRGASSWSTETKIVTGVAIACWWLLNALSTIGSKLSSISLSIKEAQWSNKEMIRTLDRMTSAIYTIRTELDRLEKQLRKMNDDDFNIPF